MRRVRRRPLPPDPSYDEVAKKTKVFAANATRADVDGAVAERVSAYIDTFQRSLEEGVRRQYDDGLAEVAELRATVVGLQRKLERLVTDTRRDVEIVEKAETQALEAIEERDSMPKSGLPLRETNV
jgi:hypothetical protein